MSQTDSDFYRAFEDRFRGPTDLIKRRLGVYLPFVEPLLGHYADPRALDLGCGRGEWLEILREIGFKAQGVDLDEGMLADARKQGLDVHICDAVEYMKSLPNESLVVVSAFHVVEHIPFLDVRALVQEALRVLRPGGLMILETPNPENIVVGTSSFYLDPTHRRPIPPQLLAFLPEYCGFLRVKILRLQEPAVLHDTKSKSLLDVLGGVSPDYSVVAQKAGTEEVLNATSQPFGAEYGLTLGRLAADYDGALDLRAASVEQRAAQTEAAVAQLEAVANRAEQRATQAEARATRAEARATQAAVHATQAAVHATQAEVHATQAEVHATQAEVHATQAEVQAAEARAVQAEARHALAESRLAPLQARIDELNGHSHFWWQQACGLEAERDALRQSWSWRITAPLRWVAGLVLRGAPERRRAANDTPDGATNALQRLLAKLIRVVLRNPTLSYRINRQLMRFPMLHRYLRGVASRGWHHLGVPTCVPPATTEGRLHVPDSSGLSLRAQKIYFDLKNAIASHRGGNG